jgi:hypothetical protein
MWVVRGTLGLVAVALAVAGCQAKPAEWAALGPRNDPAVTEEARSANTKGLHIVPQKNKSVIELKARDVIKIMRHIGCTDDQVVELGEELHDVMAQVGAARIMVGPKTEALVQADGKQVLISSASRGTFVYDVRRGQIGLPNIIPGRAVQGPNG